MSNYQSAVKRIQSADNLGKLERLERSLDNLYNMGLFTVSEFVKLDCLLMDKYCVLEESAEARNWKLSGYSGQFVKLI